MRLKFLLSFLLYSLCQNVKAHPHSWIQLTTDFSINASGELVGIRQRWVFDPYYSTLTIDDLKKTHRSLEEGLNEQVKGIIDNLEAYQYYSHLTISGNRFAIKRPHKFHLSTFVIDGQSLLILEMHFEIPAVALHSATLEWQVFDPTYYASMRHDSFEQIRISNQSALECESVIMESDPDPQTLAYASSLDVTQKDSTGLGIFFAQKVKIKCY